MQQLIKKYVKVVCKAASFNIPGMKEVKKSKERILEVGHCVLSYEKKNMEGSKQLSAEATE